MKSVIHAVKTSDGVVEFTGVLLGETENRAERHTHESTRFAKRGERCSRCRWSEYRLYRVDRYIDHVDSTTDETKFVGKYLVVSFGHSVVTDETTIRRVVATNSPAEVIELLTTRKFGQQPVITSSAARVLARASDMDDAIQEAWDNRVVL